MCRELIIDVLIYLSLLNRKVEGRFDIILIEPAVNLGFNVALSRGRIVTVRLNVVFIGVNLSGDLLVLYRTVAVEGSLTACDSRNLCVGILVFK